ncbi:rim15, signal transduction response regulator [Vermiconidia calcicola]|uniref:Rim15, signal transduction response regulator n=1 Tax=Vermiconidia calcicola TaxID=1690605 RepID=A0ACC3NAL9_9PEZI|nr:rim15, signal transduction response regulator [Vermiconidia calcicola]
MSEEAPSPASLAPPAVAALKEEAAKDGQGRGHMLRTISMDIREEREDLKRAAEESMNAILELGLDGKIKWASPSWQDLTGVVSDDILGKEITDVVLASENVFGECVEAMRKDDSKSRIVRFSVKALATPGNEDAGSSADEKTPVEGSPGFPGLSAPAEKFGYSEEQRQEATEPPKQEEMVALEAQGIMVYDRDTGEESHTMWMVKPALSREITIDLPEFLVESLGIGAEMLANYLTLLTDVGVNDPQGHPPPLPVLCRICERQITPWLFEKHTELCAQEHRAEMDVQMTQDALNEQRSSLAKVLDALEAQARLARPSPSDSRSPTPPPKAEYKGLAIGPSSNPSSGPSSGRSSPATHTPRSRDSSSSGLSHHRARSFAVRRPLARIVELVMDLCDTAMDISTPSIKDSKASAPGEFRTQSPESEGRIQQVLQWQSPSASAIENEHGLAMLCDDTFRLARAKIEAVFRHRRVLEYSERIRVEHEILVSECVEAAIDKAERIKAGDYSDSSDESSYGTPEAHPEPEEDTLKMLPDQIVTEGTTPSDARRLSGIPSSLAMALQNASDQSLGRRTSSAGSSRASSPRGAATPKSYGGQAEPFAFQKRHSMAFESDQGADSDSSMHSSVASGGRKRTGSPSAETSLSRVVSHRSRERKRQSLVLPSLVAATSNRHESPARGPPPPSSPLRMAKPRLPSGHESVPSPITSPVLSHSEFPSPIIRANHKHHHRRQSSAALSEAMGRPVSPRLNAAASNPQPRAVQTSIKDFEIIKPISKGAFGSVYLAKKKSTGDYYAIKVLKKADMVAKNQVTNVKAERAIMMWQGESDFVAKLYWTFSSKDYLYLVMEYLNGGDCASLIKVLGALPEDWTKKYIGEVVLCVQHLHSRQIVHRDLKPDNFLIESKGHLKLTDFGLSRMGLIGRQKRAINSAPEDAPPDLLKAGPFKRVPSITSSRSTSFDFQGASQSPAHTPSMIPAFNNDLHQPSYFSLNRESSGSRDPSRRTSGYRSDSGDSEALAAMFRRFSIADGRTPIEEETGDEEGAESPDPYALHPIPSNISAPRADTPPQTSAAMPPPIMALFDPEDSQRRFVGTPDYLAPETIRGSGQDEMSDWWSLGCILFECLYGCPPFNADTPEGVFQNIMSRNINWPDEDEEGAVSDDAKDLMNKLMCLDPDERLGSNRDGKYADGGEEIKAHPWFAEINWDTLREDEASFIPASENPEDTEYFDARGASMQNFAAEFEDQQSSPAPTPGAEYPDRPHDALSRVRSQVNAVKRNLMPLHIPPHVRDGRSRRLSEPVVADDFGNFQFKNLPVLEKANKDVIQKLRADAMQAQAKSAQAATSSSSAVSPSPAPSLESSPILPMPLKRTLSANRGHTRPQSPSLLSQTESSPSRGSHPSSPLLVSFSAGQNHERRKTSSGSSSLSQQTSNPSTYSNSLQPGNFFEQVPRMPVAFKTPSNTPSPIKGAKPGSIQLPLAHERSGVQQRQASVTTSPRQRSHTVGSQEGDLVPELMPTHYKRRSGVFDVSPSSSDTEETRQKALLRVQRRRASSRRLSQVSLADGPSFRTLDVLVCEDHPVSRLVMERLLEKLRCRTIAVTNGSEAIRYAMSEVKFDIIMMEYKLPHLNGADVARMIRDTKNANSHTPIVAVTGYLKELQAPHHFDALVEKPPTKEKLEEVMGRLCQWKAAPEGWEPPLPQTMPHSNLRQESMPADDSPTTTTSSGFGGFGPAVSSSYVGSSRGDSIGSSQLSSIGDGDSQFESIPVIISRQATGEWDQADLERNFGGLGITNTETAEPKADKHMHAPPALVHQKTAPPSLGAGDFPAPRKQPSMEAMEAKRRSLEKVRIESAAESGDDEDDELGNVSVRARSPRRNVKRTSKLGTEMLRTNSQGSVISAEDFAAENHGATEPALHAVEPTIAEEPAAEVEAAGHITPPTFFPRQPGDHTEIIDMDANTSPSADPNATPRPHHSHEPDPDPTPKASVSPQHQD